MIITVKATEEKKGNLFTDALESVKKGWSKFKSSKAFTSVRDGLGTAYEKVKELSSKHWKSAVLVTGTSFTAGLVVPGAWFIPVSAAFYAGIKTLSYYTRYKGAADGNDMLITGLKHFGIGFLSSSGVLFSLAPIYFLSSIVHEGFVDISEVFDFFAYTIIA